MIGISITGDRFELACGEWTGRPRYLDDPTVANLERYGKRYGELLARKSPAEGLLVLGADLFNFLEGNLGELTTLLGRAPRPVHFEIAAPTSRPDQAMLMLLRAPWELLAKDRVFLASDVALGFSPIRRLGRAIASPPPLDRYRLGVAFMAASPRGAQELDYEAEESAITHAVGAAELDLYVEESGNPIELGDRLAELPAMQALHLSCHGHNAWPPNAPAEQRRPILMLEGEAGDALETDAGQLIQTLRSKPPRLLFVSACLTAAGGGDRRPTWAGDKKPGDASAGLVAQSLAESMIDGGFPAVIGWDGSVMDRAATAFATVLYDDIAGRRDLADAIGNARRKLLADPDETIRNDWHLARLWLGAQGGGPLVGGRARRDLVPTHGEKEFLGKQEVPVAAHDMFVGRRRELQKVLREMREGGHAGVLLHGMGRLGKSSLAARITNRRHDLRPAVVFAHYQALDILAAIEDALRDNPKARVIVREGEKRVRENPDALEDVLVDLLSVPCTQAETGTPVFLVIDDLERILVAGPAGGRHRVMPEYASVQRAVLRAFDRTIDSRLLLTSRFPFVLDGLEKHLFELQLPPLTEAAQRKLQLRQAEVAIAKDTEPVDVKERLELLARVPGIARGNPGLQDLIGLKLVLSIAVTPAHAGKVLDEMDAWLAHGDLPTDAEVRAFLENLAVDSLINLAGDAGRQLLRNLTLFDLPVPYAVAERVGAGVDANVQHLCDLGLVDVLEDLVDPSQGAVAVNRLAVGRLEPLGEKECSDLARVFSSDLFLAWGGLTKLDKRPLACDLQLTNLGLVAENTEIISCCGTRAILALKQGPAREATALGQSAIKLLLLHNVPVPLRLLSETAEAALRGGDGSAADELLARGADIIAEQRLSGPNTDPMAAGFLTYTLADRLLMRGEHDQATQLFGQAAEFAAAAGRELSAVIARGRIAEILYRRGDLDAALRIQQEEQLPAYERMGEVVLRVLTMSQIGDIHRRRGDIDEAQRIYQQEVLPVYDRLRNVRERAVVLGKIADIHELRGDLDEALRIRQEEELPVYEHLGEAREHAATQGKIADIFARRHEVDKALEIYRGILPSLERLGDIQLVAVCAGKIAEILQYRGDLDGALRIRQEKELPIYDRLGDLPGRAYTTGDIADILERQGDIDRTASAS